MFSVKYFVFLFTVANWIALLEVQIEGKNGWASALPCWRARPDAWYNKLYGKIIGGGLPLTGYHAFLFSLVFLFLHLPFFVSTHWTVAEELKVWSAYFLLCITWDFLYFVWSPYFMVTGNGPNSISSNKTMLFGIFPGDYMVGLAASFLFTLFASLFSGEVVIGDWFGTVSFTVLSCAILCFVVQCLKGKV